MVTPVYGIAGVPLAQVRFARALSKHGFDVDLVIGRIYPEIPVPEVPGVNVIKIDKIGVRRMFLPMVRYLRRAKPEVVFSAEDHLNGVVLLAAIASGTRAKISGSSRVPPSDSYSNTPLSKGWIRKQLMKAVMWRADALTCVSADMVENYGKYFAGASHDCVHNIIDDELSRLKMHEPVEHDWFADSDVPIIVAAGTLTQRKGFADLIEAMALLSERLLARLLILGEGPRREELLGLVETHNLQDRVQLAGLVDNPLKFFRHCQVIALSSYAEGLPNVLVEGMLCGCTPVATDCETGPREVLQDGKYGYLVPVGDAPAMAAAIAEALDKPIPDDLLKEAIKSFSEHAVIKRHFEVLGLGDQKVEN